MTAETDLAFFILLARKGSFAAAALELGVSPPAVSKRLAKLEDRLGVRLLNRTTRRVSMTGEGEAYYERAIQILRDIDDLNESLTDASATPKGLLRINATFGFGREHVATIVSEFSKCHPLVEIQLVLSDAPFNLVEERFDLGIRFGSQPNSRLIARKLQCNRRLMCAAPSYLEQHGAPQRLEDLEHHNCIVLRQDNETYDLWKLQRNDRLATIKVRGALSSNDGEIALKWVLDGHGVMLRSEWDILRHVEADRLRLVLPRYSQPDADIYAVYPARHNLSAKVRAFVNFLADRLKQRFGELPAS
ncbi:LysR family transcriptional regulator [Filomicrobium sp.]|uniref:LysR family transcriptional regulator n=1 Tax=Filomicrobium sp. TaxID=2024831 RepID=UPI002583CB4A|nr:LysR family transcriptional regulator [Filomicrobium sp.]MCV0370760.1 LysR family transcriptional regulator [Filomicrobium sp.]